MEIPLAALVDRVEETDTQLSLIGIVGLIRVNVVPTIVKRDMKLFIRVRFDPSRRARSTRSASRVSTPAEPYS